MLLALLFALHPAWAQDPLPDWAQTYQRRQRVARWGLVSTAAGTALVGTGALVAAQGSSWASCGGCLPLVAGGVLTLGGPAMMAGGSRRAALALRARDPRASQAAGLLGVGLYGTSLLSVAGASEGDALIAVPIVLFAGSIVSSGVQMHRNDLRWSAHPVHHPPAQAPHSVEPGSGAQ
jgi:hypothetical protein